MITWLPICALLSSQAVIGVSAQVPAESDTFAFKRGQAVCIIAVRIKPTMERGYWEELQGDLAKNTLRAGGAHEPRDFPSDRPTLDRPLPERATLDRPAPELNLRAPPDDALKNRIEERFSIKRSRRSPRNCAINTHSATIRPIGRATALTGAFACRWIDMTSSSAREEDTAQRARPRTLSDKSDSRSPNRKPREKTMRFDRRGFLKGVIGAGASGLPDAYADEQKPQKEASAGPKAQDLDRAAAAPVLRLGGLNSPVIIESIRLLKKDTEYFVHVRSKDGAEGVSLTNPPRAQYLDKILKQLVIPFFVGKDARDLENLLWDLYRWRDNYKLYGLALWCPQAWVEFAILDMLGRIAAKPIGALLGEIVRKEVAIYVASGRRDTTPEQEAEHLQKLVEQSGAKALKFRVGGRMSRNADAQPGRTERLIPLVRKTFGDAVDLHADSNSSYDPPQAIKVGRLLEEIKAVYFEEPCQFDNLEDTKVVTDALAIPVAGGEQEYSHWRFRWMIANRGVDIVQPDLHYYGGMIRSVRVARMAALARMPTTVHLSGGFGFVYMLHFASCVPDIGRYQEYKLGTEKYGGWFDPPIVVKAGKVTVPSGVGVGIKDVAGLLNGTQEV